MFNTNLSLDKKYEIKNMIFSLAWCLLLIQVLTIDSFLPKLPFSLSLFCMLLLAVCAIFPFDYNFKEIAIIFTGGIFTLLLCYRMKVNIILWVYAFIVCSKGISLKPLFKKTLFIYIVFFISCIALSRLGIIGENIRDNGGTMNLKHSLGMGDANSAHAMLLFIFTLMLYIYYSKINIWHLIAMAAINYIIYKLTYSRTSLLIIYFILFSAALEKTLKPRISDKLYHFLCGAFIFAIISSVILFTIVPFMYNSSIPLANSIAYKLNHIITGRVYLANSFLNDYGIHPFGVYIGELLDPVTRYRYLDIGYSVLLIQFGYIYYIIYVGGYLALFVRFFKRNDFAAILAISSILLFMTNENITTIIFYNFTYFFFRDFIFTKMQDKKC